MRVWLKIENFKNRRKIPAVFLFLATSGTPKSQQNPLNQYIYAKVNFLLTKINFPITILES